MAWMEESFKRTSLFFSIARYSFEVKSLFKKLGVEPFVVELDELGAQGPQMQKVPERLTSQHTVPNVCIGGQHIGGCSIILQYLFVVLRFLSFKKWNMFA